MNFKTRFAILFTFFVGIILLIACISTYLLFYESRQDDYFKRVGKEGLEVHKIFVDIRQDDPSIAYRIIKDIHDKALYYEQVYILDSSGKMIFRFPDTLRVPKVLPVSLATLRNGEEFRAYDDKHSQLVAMFIPETESFVFVSGFDRQGLARLSMLRIILVIVYIGGLILSVFFSLFFVRQAVKPLKELSTQMKKTTVQNLTERVDERNTNDEVNEIARSFNSMLERLSKSFDFQKNFVYHASHELRTPLATMLSQTESALNRELKPDEYRRILRSLKEDQQEMIELTNSLLLISQFEHMEYVQDWPLLRIDEMIYETVSHCKKIFPDLQVSITFASLPDDDNDFTIRGNETVLKSAFTNLIKNAYTYSVDQKVSITLDSDSNAIFVHLDNTGTQLPADEKENIMIPFFRGGNALTSKGYGLGLSIVYRFIAIHKGTVTYTPIASNVNRFTVTLQKQPSH